MPKSDIRWLYPQPFNNHIYYLWILLNADENFVNITTGNSLLHYVKKQKRLGQNMSTLTLALQQPVLVFSSLPTSCPPSLRAWNRLALQQLGLLLRQCFFLQEHVCISLILYTHLFNLQLLYVNKWNLRETTLMLAWHLGPIKCTKS